MTFLTTLRGKMAVLFVFYIPFLSAIFFRFFEGQEFESPIGGCCISMEGVVIGGYGLFTVWILTPLSLVYGGYRLYRKVRS